MIRGDHNVIPPLHGAVDPGSREQAFSRRKSRPGDAVEISEGARNLRGEKNPGSRQAGSTCGAEGGASMVKSQIRVRITTGFYESEEVLRRIADRLVDLFGF